ELNNDRPSSTADYFARLRREEVVRREEAQANVAGHVNRARALEAGLDFDGAIAEYQAALAIVSWWADATGFPVNSDSLKATIDAVKEKKARYLRKQNSEAAERAYLSRVSDLRKEKEERLGRIRAFFREADLAFRRGE